MTNKHCSKANNTNETNMITACCIMLLQPPNWTFQLDLWFRYLPPSPASIIKLCLYYLWQLQAISSSRDPWMLLQFLQGYNVYFNCCVTPTKLNYMYILNRSSLASFYLEKNPFATLGSLVVPLKHSERLCTTLFFWGHNGHLCLSLFCHV